MPPSSCVYFVAIGWRGVRADPGRQARAASCSGSRCSPCRSVGLWAVVRELALRRATETLAERARGARRLLPVDDLPAAAGGRVDRTAADAWFEGLRREVERAAGVVGGVVPAGLGYDAAGDRRRARAAMRRAAELHTRRALLRLLLPPSSIVGGGDQTSEAVRRCCVTVVPSGAANVRRAPSGTMPAEVRKFCRTASGSGSHATTPVTPASRMVAVAAARSRDPWPAPWWAGSTARTTISPTSFPRSGSRRRRDGDEPDHRAARGRDEDRVTGRGGCRDGLRPRLAELLRIESADDGCERAAPGPGLYGADGGGVAAAGGTDGGVRGGGAQQVPGPASVRASAPCQSRHPGAGGPLSCRCPPAREGPGVSVPVGRVRAMAPTDSTVTDTIVPASDLAAEEPPKATFRTDVTVELVEPAPRTPTCCSPPGCPPGRADPGRSVDADAGALQGPDQLPDAGPARQPVRAQLDDLLRQAPIFVFREFMRHRDR